MLPVKGGLIWALGELLDRARVQRGRRKLRQTNQTKPTELDGMLEVAELSRQGQTWSCNQD